ncbi:GNAT family N-acetyltransferase [Corynebacterium timonense]|uniref:Acetyltransferase (GNAT) family protein n=1 Tax=Corynebacterium timonense TaxID=441500 RepID=A0A1H1S1T6_9CORY|nr:GNAT family N-acetyltransferase [Corynebacterium timonense]SDS41931.1 Acetyltransferase (GNAT) family protein [Corynebacterium timonense]
MTFTLREATESDRTYLHRLNFLTEVFGDENGEVGEDIIASAAAYVGDWDPDRDGGVIALDHLGIPAGGVWLRRWASPDDYGWAAPLGPDVPELAIAVENRYAGHRLGAQLLEAACDLARRQGAQRISLHVEPNNPRAHHRYVSSGFTELSPEESGCRPVTMVRAL